MTSTVIITILTIILAFSTLSSYLKGKKIKEITENLIDYYENDGTMKGFKARFGSLMYPYDDR